MAYKLNTKEQEVVFALASKLTNNYHGGEYRRDVLVNHVETRMHACGEASLARYLDLAQSSSDEFAQLMSALTIHTTEWFREMPHFVAITDHIKARYASGTQKPMQILSLGCSSGEEVYSFGLALERLRRTNPRFDYKIQGWDVDPVSVKQAAKGVYSKAFLAQIPREYWGLVLLGSGNSEGYFTLDPLIRSRCQFATKNLFQVSQHLRAFDLIICRNVLIYFSPQQVKELLASFKRAIVDDGVICLGHSEAVTAAAHGLVSKGRAIYQIAPAAAAPVPATGALKPRAAAPTNAAPVAAAPVPATGALKPPAAAPTKAAPAAAAPVPATGALKPRAAAPTNAAANPGAATTATKAAANPGAAAAATKAAANPGAALTALVVAAEKQPPIAQLLQKNGFVVTAATTAGAATQAINLRSFSLLVCSVDLPGFDAGAWLRAVRGRGITTACVVVAGANDDANAALGELIEGVQDFIARDAIVASPSTVAVRLKELASSSAKRLDKDKAKTAGKNIEVRARPAVIVVGASTGGPDALSELLRAMPADCPPILVVQHIVPAFARAFAERLARTAQLQLGASESGTLLAPGHLYLALADYHIKIKRNGDQWALATAKEAPVNGHRPSVDTLFQSAAKGAASVLAILLTGMGKDGAQGLKELKDAGAFTMAQDEHSSIVYGMPKEAVRLKAVSAEGSLTELRAAILAACQKAPLRKAS